jgi:hypothetical protein
MSRTVVQVFEVGEVGRRRTSKVRPRLLVSLNLPPDRFPNADVPGWLGCAQHLAPFRELVDGRLLPEVVKRVGTRLYLRLSAHPAAGPALVEALTTTRPPSTAPLYVRVEGAEAEMLPWEMLCSPGQGFLALDERWPIARMSGNPLARTQVIERAFEPPLRVMAVLAATAIDATGEWEALESVFLDAKRRTKVQLELYVSQAELKNRIQLLGDPRVSATMMPSEASELLAAAQSLRPHVLHWFCHGSTVGGPHLELATQAAWANKTSDLSIEPDDLVMAGELARINWMTTLNACEGGAATSDLGSFASTLVSRGFPAVVAMREPVDSSDANLFSSVYYRGVLDEIERCLGPDPNPPHVEWARALLRARRQLAERYGGGRAVSAAAADTTEWTRPVLYVGPEPFRLRAPSSAARLGRERRRMLQTQLTQLLRGRDFVLTQEGTSPAMLAEIDQRIADLRAQLYPPP